jgi:glycosyltransferase involved in cell wall biosynthesis
MVLQPQAYDQFKKTFNFNDKVVMGRYPCDLDAYFYHPVRQKKDGYNLIFPNRLTENYNPIAAIEIFSKVFQRYPTVRLRLNAVGELRKQVEKRIDELDLRKAVVFLDNIKKWGDLSDIYADSDIMIFPAKFSTGNYTIIECMVSGMVCLISDGVTYLKGNDVKGAIEILPLEYDYWVERISWYIENPESFKRIATINRNEYAFRTMSQTAEFYAETINNDLIGA